MKLYTYYRSTASYRVRIALNYKNIPHELIPVDLISDQHKQDNFKKHNRHGRVPALSDNHFELGQSAAILEYLEEKYPNPTLLPSDLQARAKVRYLSQIVISDMHPLNNSGVLKYLNNHCDMDATQIKTWYHHWLKQGFDALESILANDPHSKTFCIGDKPTFADICLIPQISNAFRFDFSMQNYPTLLRINQHCLSLPYFEKAKPENQPDYLADRPSTTFP